MQVVYANQIVSLIFFTLRGLGLYHSRRVIYQTTKFTSSESSGHSLALRNRYYTSNRSKTTDSLPQCRVKVSSRERQCSTMALAPFISTIKRQSSDERPVLPALRSASRLRKCSNDQSKSTVHSRRVLYLARRIITFLSRSFSLVTQDSGSLGIEMEISLQRISALIALAWGGWLLQLPPSPDLSLLHRDALLEVPREPGTALLAILLRKAQRKYHGSRN